MISINVKSNIDQVIRDLQAKIPRVVEQAQVSALNKTADGAKTRMVRAISATYKIDQRTVRERLFIARASRKGGATFSASLIGSGKRSMNVIHFLEKKVTLAEGKRRRKGGTLTQLRFEIKRGKKVTIAGQFGHGAFIGNDGRTVFERRGKSRLPIEPVQTINIPGMFNSRKNIGEVQAWINENFPRIFRHELAYYMGRTK